MPHVRQQLRSAAVTALTGLTTTGARVRTARIHPLTEAESPALVINTTSEEVETLSMDPQPIVQRAVLLQIEGIVRGASGLADTLDTVATEVETALGGQITVGGVVVPLAYQGASIEFSAETDLPVGTVTLRYSAQLFTRANAPQTLVQA